MRFHLSRRHPRSVGKAKSVLGREEEIALQELESRRTTACAVTLRLRFVLGCAAGEKNLGVAAVLASRRKRRATDDAALLALA